MSLVWGPATGAASYDTDALDSSRAHTLLVAVTLRIGGISTQSLLDTGAEWSVVGGELGRLLREEAGEPIEELAMVTRFGKFSGELRRCNVTLVADRGANLTFEATLWYPENWPLEFPIIGYRGFLDRVRFALDPLDDPPSIYFSS